jgi:hypothetical protein
VVDSTPVECIRSRETLKRSELAGWAQFDFERYGGRTVDGVAVRILQPSWP